MHARSEAAGRRSRGGPRSRAQADRAHARDVSRTARRLIALALVASCSKSAPPPPAPAPAPVVVVDAAAPLVTSHQLVTAITPDWSATTAQLQLWERENGSWVPVLKPWTGVVGGAGTAWGVGVHGAGPPAGRSGPVKQEGDRKSPAGVFAIRDAYGYKPAARSGLPFHVVDGDWKCVDDPSSKQYTRVLDSKGITKDWASAEDMRRKDELYTYVVDIAHNPGATPGAGSCIFFHVWRGPASSTVGCTAMPEARLAELIGKLEPTAMYVLLPQDEYTALATRWDLPR
jgi:D-alanyl-D-alanine dipeptidase